MEIHELRQDLIQRTNNNSFYNRGTNTEQCYKAYANEVIEWPISEVKKQKILDNLYKKYSKILEYESQHVPVMVAGPAKYNSKRLDKSEQILKASHELSEWFEDLRKQVENAKKDDSKEEKVKYIIDGIKRLIQLNLDPTKDIMNLATIDNKKFIEVYEQLQEKYKWRKNSNIYKLYQASINGEVKEIRKKIIYEDENFTSYIEGDRAYIKFTMKCKRQLIYALKKKGWWWNSYKSAWSTYLDRVNTEWIKNISEKYEEYL